MKIAVAGLWHLGCVTAACCARHFQVVGLDFDSETIATLNRGSAPLFEPGLDDLIADGLREGRLGFTTDPVSASASADILWLTYDTPVDENDVSDVDFVLLQLRRCLPHLREDALVLISSQLPVGTCRQFEAEYPQFHFACSPENLRLGRALDTFANPDRVVVGLRIEDKKPLIEKLFHPFTDQILWMRPESAEMVKHGLNAFLALSISFINEVARLCERTGADTKEVSAGLKSDSRIGSKAYLRPGGAFAGGTLARDVVTLTRLAAEKDEPLSLIPAIQRSNDEHRSWPLRRLQSRLGNLHGRCIALLGLTYTPNTNTLRRSAAVELCQKLLAAGAVVRAFDPAVRTLPTELARVDVVENVRAAVVGADAAVICTEWPQFQEADWTELLPLMLQPVIIDANRFLDSQLKAHAHVEHLSVGRAA